MPWWVTGAIELAKLWQNELVTAVVTVVVTIVVGAGAGVTRLRKWLRRQHLQTLLLMREMGIHMIQNRPQTDNQLRLQQNLTWWEAEVLKVLPKAGATPGQIGRFQHLGNVYHGTIIAEKIARLDEIIEKLEGRDTR